MQANNKIIKCGNLIQGKVYYSLRHAIYWPKGCAPALTAAMGISPCLTCDLEHKFLVVSKAKASAPRLRYALGRTNHSEGYGTSSFHANPYFNTVTAAQATNRRQWIAEIE